MGALMFGEGHVMRPLLQVVVPLGWVLADTFLAGYGATQAVPGPLFAFAAFLGAAMAPWPGGWLGALVCLVAIIVPSWRSGACRPGPWCWPVAWAVPYSRTGYRF